MSDLIAIVYPSEAKAEEVRQRIFELQKEYLITVGDAVIATKSADGKIKLNQMFNKASATDEVKAYMKQTSGTLTSSTPEGLAKFQATESKKWGEVIRAAGIEQQ